MEELVLLVSNRDGMIAWDPDTGVVQTTYKQCSAVPRGVSLLSHRHDAASVEYSDCIAVAQENRPALHIWRLTKEQPLFRCSQRDRMCAVATHPSGAYCCAGSASGWLLWWKVSTGALIASWRAHFKAVSSLCFSDDGGMLLSGGEDGAIHAWRLLSAVDADRPDESPRPFRSWTEHSLAVTSLRRTAAGSAGGPPSRFLSASLDGTVRLWDTSQSSSVAAVSCGVPLHAAVADDREMSVFAAGGDGCVHHRSLDPDDASSSTPTPTSSSSSSSWSWSGHAGAVLDLALLRDGARLVTAAEDGTCRVWDTASGQTVRVWKPGDSDSQRAGALIHAVVPVHRRAVVGAPRVEAASAPVAPLQTHVATEDGAVSDAVRSVVEPGLFGDGPSDATAEQELLETLSPRASEFLRAWLRGDRPRSVPPAAQNAGEAGTAARVVAHEIDELQQSYEAQLAALQQQLDEVRDENQRWKNVNNALMARLGEAGSAQPAGKRPRNK